MKKKVLLSFMFLVSFVMAVSLFTAPVLNAATQSFVACHGQLKVQGNRIVDAYGQAITLRGMSMYAWASQGLQYYNPTAVARLVNEWKCTVLRIPILPGSVGSQESLVRTVVDACIANGIYAIVDWHSMGGSSAAACSDFMKRMATAYGNTPNVMYETWNEPVTETWPALKIYHQQVIAAIRSVDPDNIIFCGDPQWDQNPQQAANDPITTSTNIAYVVHFYAASHGQWLRDNVTAALNKGVAIFATEYGTGTADGNGNLDTASTQAWWNFLDANGVGCTNWSVSALGEESAAFNPGTSATNWTDANLKPSGVFVKNYIVTKNTPLWGACGGSSTVVPTSTSVPPTAVPTNTVIYTPTATPVPLAAAVPCGQGIVIDGGINDAAWQDGTWVTNSRLITGTNPQNVSSKFKVRWDNTNLYVAVDVTDPSPYNDSGAAWYDDSSVEVYLDMNHNRSAAYGTDDFQFSMRYNDQVLREENNRLGTAFGAVAARTGGYVVEMRLPWTTLGVTPAQGAVYGLDIGVNIDSNGGTREGVLMWNGTTNNWSNTAAFGDAVLGTACAAATFTSTATNTALPPTATNTPITPTATPTTPVPTGTFTKTNTPITPTATPTTPVPTNTPITLSPTPTTPVPTNTPITPSPTPTTPVPTNTPITPSPTPTTPVPTNTPITPTATPTTPVPTDTPITPSPTPTTPVPTNTPITPSPTPTTPVPTNTPITPTATPTTPVPTNTPITATATPTTPVPTNTAVIPTSTPTTPVSTSFKFMLKNLDTNNTTGSPHPQIRVINTGSSAANLNNIEVRYWFSCDCTGQAVQAYIDYAGKMPQGTSLGTNAQVSVVAAARGSQTGYISFKFTGNITLQPNEYVEVQARFNKSDWSNMTQSNDWSFSNSQNWVQYQQLTGYSGGSLIWGQEPPVSTNTVVVANVLSYPNPSTAATGATLQYTVNQVTTGVTATGMDPIYVPDPATKVYLKIFSVAGRLIWEQTLDGVYYIATGTHSVQWDGKAAGGHELTAGSYIFKVLLKEPSGSSTGFSTIIMLK